MYKLNKSVAFFDNGTRSERHKIISKSLIDIYSEGEKYRPRIEGLDSFRHHFLSYRKLLSTLFQMPLETISEHDDFRNHEYYYTGNIDVDTFNIDQSKVEHLKQLIEVRNIKELKFICNRR